MGQVEWSGKERLGGGPDSAEGPFQESACLPRAKPDTT